MKQMRLGLSVTLAVLLCLAAAGGQVRDTTLEDELKQRVYAELGAEGEKGFTRKGPPKAGEWLATHPEPPQPFELYRRAVRVRPSAERRTIVLLPLGTMNDEQKKLLEDLRDYAEAFFQLPARVEKPVPLELRDSQATLTRTVLMPLRRGTYETQYNADVILDSILPKLLPKDAVVCLGITMEDLYSEDLNYVFGLGNMEARVGVYSLARYFPEFWNQKRLDGAEKTALLRSCKVLNHETGHMFGLPHCVFYECSMNGSNSLQETDRAPVHFCPVCRRKLLWNTGCDAEKRFEALRTFYAKHQLKAEADFMQTQLEQWKKATAADKARAVKEE